MDMALKYRQADFKWFPIAIIVLYVPFHLLEEALDNFPQWMYVHYGLPAPLSYPHWLINNFVFLGVLLVGLFIFLKNSDKNIAFGLGIVFWGFMNSLEHIIFSLLDAQLAPGFFTAVLFLLLAIWGTLKLKSTTTITEGLLLKSFLIAVTYWVVALVVIVVTGAFLVQIFPYG